MIYKQQRPFLFGWFLQIILHFIVASAIALVIVGAVQSNTPTNNAGSAHALEIAGVILFGLIWILFVFMVTTLWHAHDLAAMKRRVSITINIVYTTNQAQLLIAITICTPLLGMRTLYSILGACINNSSWSFTNGGTLAEQVVLQVLPEVLILIVLNIAGVLSSSSETAFGSPSRGHSSGHTKQVSRSRGIEMRSQCR